jgi:hypothetical protein
LQKQLNVPADELELAKDINDIISALISQLVMTVLQGGLNSSSGDSGGQPSYISQIAAEANTPVNTSNTTDAIASLTSPVQQYKTTYDQAVQTLTTSQSNLVAAQACYANASSTLSAQLVSLQNQLQNTQSTFNPYNGQCNNMFGNSSACQLTGRDLILQEIASTTQEIAYVNAEIANIASYIQTQVAPVITNFQAKQASASAQLAQSQNLTSGLSAQQLVNKGGSISDTASSISISMQTTGLPQAQSDLQSAQSSASTFNNVANSYQTDCNSANFNASHGYTPKSF